MAELDTRVSGDPAACRATGEWMRGAAGDVREGGTVLRRVRTDSQAVWRGEAGDAFREHLGRGGQDADDLSDAVESAGGAMLTFAGELDTVTARMTQARDVASAAGLTVTATGIQPPGPAPVAPAGYDVARFYEPQMQEAWSRHVASVEAHNRQVGAWNEVNETVGQARGTERVAHETLARRIREHGTLWANVRQNRFFITAGALTGGLGELQNAAGRWRAVSTDAGRVAGQARNLLNGSMSQAGRDTALRIMLEREAVARQAGRAATSNARMLGVLDDTRAGRALLKITGNVRGVPVAGAALTAWQAKIEIDNGKEADRAIASGVAGQIAGTAATSGTLLLVGAAGGPVTLGAVALGVGASIVVSWAVDEYWDDIEDGAAAGGDAVQKAHEFQRSNPDVRL